MILLQICYVNGAAHLWEKGRSFVAFSVNPDTHEANVENWHLKE
jgi:hypothetical protein